MDLGNNNAACHILSGGGIAMSDLRIKSNEDNGDLFKQLELFDDEDNEMNWLKDSYNPFESVEEEFLKQFRDQRNK